MRSDLNQVTGAVNVSTKTTAAIAPDDQVAIRCFSDEAKIWVDSDGFFCFKGDRAFFPIGKAKDIVFRAKARDRRNGLKCRYTYVRVISAREFAARELEKLADAIGRVVVPALIGASVAELARQHARELRSGR